MELCIDPSGCVRFVYSEVLDLSSLGSPTILRASSVEPDATGFWYADLGQVGGPVRGPFSRRSDALRAEHRWLEEHWLVPAPDI